MPNTDLTLIIGGVDFLPYVPDEGIEWSRNDVDSSNAGELQDGTVRRDRVIIRRKMTVKINSLDTATMSRLQQAILPQWVEVQFLDPILGEVTTETFYSNNVAATAAKQTTRRDGTKVVKWKGFTFPLIAKGVAGYGAV